METGNEMDPTLAAIYGTGGDAASDATKTAAANALEEVSDFDISQLSPEQIEELAGTVLSGGEENPEVEEPATEGGEMEKEAAAKFAEADYTGRVMAHSMVNELNKIAGARTEAAKASFGAAKNTVKEVGGKVSKYLGGKARAANQAMHHHAKKSIGAAAVLGAAGGAAAMHKHHKKHASAFDTLVEGRMAEICKELEIDPAALDAALTGNVEEAPAEKTASAAYEQLGGLVEETAINQLVALGLVEQKS